MYLHPVYAVDENTRRQDMDDKWYEYVEVQGKKVRMLCSYIQAQTMHTTVQHVLNPSEETTTSEDHSEIDVVFRTPARH